MILSTYAFSLRILVQNSCNHRLFSLNKPVDRKITRELGIKDFAEYEEFMHIKYVAEQLREAEIEAESPNAEWQDCEDVLGKLRAKYHGL